MYAAQSYRTIVLHIKTTHIIMFCSLVLMCLILHSEHDFKRAICFSQIVFFIPRAERQ